MKEKIYENPNTDEDRQERAQKKQKGRAGRVVLMILGFIVIAIAVFLGTIKLVQPDFKIAQLIPESVSQTIDEKLLGKTTTTETTTAAPETTTETTTEAPVEADAAYLPIEEFKLDNGKKGNHMGNILNGGLVGTDASYIYHIVDKKGIYRFEPYSEGYARVYQSESKLSCLNLKGDYIYFVNDDEAVLYRMKKGTSKPEKLAESVDTAYVYDNRIIFVTTDNSVKTMTTDKLKEKELYSTADEVQLIGTSLKRVFFSVKDVNNKFSYITVDFKNKKGEQLFRQPTYGDELVAPVMENGFLYFFEKQEDGSYNLIRQKYGSEKTVTLIKNVTSLNPVIVYNNRLFYSELDGKSFKAMELNMNSEAVKTLLSVKNAGSENTLVVQHGGEYDFIIGAKNADGDKVYSASSIYTGSANIMRFKDGRWSYK